MKDAPLSGASAIGCQLATEAFRVKKSSHSARRAQARRLDKRLRRAARARERRTRAPCRLPAPRGVPFRRVAGVMVYSCGCHVGLYDAHGRLLAVLPKDVLLLPGNVI